MIRDARTTFGAPVALNTGAAGDYVIGDIIDLTNTGRDIGAGEGIGDIFLYVVMATAGAGAGASLQVSLGTSDAANLSSPTKVITSAAIPVAQLAAGFVVFALRLPPAVYKRYIGIIQTTSGAAFTAGAVHAFFAEDVNAIRYYAQGFTG